MSPVRTDGRALPPGATRKREMKPGGQVPGLKNANRVKSPESRCWVRVPPACPARCMAAAGAGAWSSAVCKATS